MRVGLGLRLSAAIAALACLTPDALAVGQAEPDSNVVYSAESVLLAGGNSVVIPSGSLSYSVLGPIGIPAASGVTVTFRAPAGNTFALTAGQQCSWAGVITIPVAAANAISCTAPPAGGPYFSVQLTSPTPAGPQLSGPDVAILGQNIYPGLTPAGNNPSAKVQITAQATSGGIFVGDAAPLPNLALLSRNSFSLTSQSRALQVDLTGDDLTQGPPGAVFITNNANGTRSPSRAGYLGSFGVTVSQFDPDARTGQFCINGPTNGNNAACAAAITGNVNLTLTGDFATLTSAYLLPNTTSGALPVANAASCTPAAPANALLGTIDAAKRNITFATFQAPNTQFSSAQPVYGVCLVTNGTQVIQREPNVRWVVSVDVPTKITLTPAPNGGFGSIDYDGTTFLAQNVFGFVQTGTRTYFRVVNQSNTPAKVWAVLTKDVTNQDPAAPNGSCTFAVGGTAPITATCNVSFVAELTSTFVTSNTASSKGRVQPNTATYYTGDDIAALAGTTVTNPTNGFLNATVRLLSPNSGVAFSALSQSASGLLVNTP